MTDDGIPRVIDPQYLMHEYLVAVGEMEELLAELRNADSETRLSIIEGTLSQSDRWLDYRYNRVGFTDEMRMEADMIFLSIQDYLRGMEGQ
jgi:hypothetical protein